MHGTLVPDLALVLGVAAVTSVLSRTWRQPSILGYLLAGLIVGPYLPIPVFCDPVLLYRKLRDPIAQLPCPVELMRSASEPIAVF